MNLEQLLSAMQGRMPWRVANKILAEYEFPCGRGWENTLEKIKNFTPSEEQFFGLLARYQEHIVCGEKSLRVYEVTDEQLDHLRDLISKAEIPETDYSTSYPMPIDHEKLSTLPASVPELVRVENSEDGMMAIYSSVRVAEVRVSLKPNDVPEQARELFDEYTEVVGIQASKTQAFDAVWIPQRGNKIDVRVDFPFGITQDAMANAHGGVRNVLSDTIGAIDFGTPMNLFPIIDGIYRASDEGTVVELAFGTTTASLKHEKMRRRQQCLRKEIYHMGGTKAVHGEIEPFKLGVEWCGPTRGLRPSFPELILNGTSRMLHSTNPILTEGTIRKCTGVHDFEFVRAKIESYLPRD